VKLVVTVSIWIRLAQEKVKSWVLCYVMPLDSVLVDHLVDDKPIKLIDTSD